MHFRNRARAGICLLAVFVIATAADAGPLRIVTYNIEADTGGYTTPRPGMSTVLQGIGNESVNGTARPVDLLALQETTSNDTTVAAMVDILDNLYGAGTYAMSPYQATQNGSPSSGNGPNALVYNGVTLQLIASVGIGTPSSSGAPRQPVRYQLRPMGGTSASDFYIYVSHCKAGVQTSDEERRYIEAQLLRSDEATLPSSARVIYSGDLNLTGASESCWQTLTAAGQGQAFDPANRVGEWDNNSAFLDVLTESSTSLRYRDDFLLVTQNVLDDASGLQYVAGSYHTFGIDGSVGIGKAVTSSSNTALAGLPNRSAVLSALTTAADHLPVVADFNLTIGPPTIGLSITSLERTSWRGNALPTDNFSVSNTGGGTLNYTITSSSGWISPSPAGGTSTGEADSISLVYSTATLLLGDYSATITVADAGATNSPQTLSIALRVYTPGDFDHDGDVDQSNFGFLQACYTESGQQPTASCRPADLNLDHAVNSLDLNVFVGCMGGAGRSPGC